MDELVNRPLLAAMSKEFEVEGGRICGIVDISEEGTICIPDIVMEMFDIKCGDKVLLLADKKQGLALVKCSRF